MTHIEQEIRDAAAASVLAKTFKWFVVSKSTKQLRNGKKWTGGAFFLGR